MKLHLDETKLINAVARRQQSLNEFAHEAGISSSTIYSIIRRGKLNVKILGKMAKTLNITDPTDLLLDEVANEKSDS